LAIIAASNRKTVIPTSILIKTSFTEDMSVKNWREAADVSTPTNIAVPVDNIPVLNDAHQGH
jgi:hypothetical protein